MSSIIAKGLWAMVATAIAFGVNVHMQPRYEAAFERSESPDAVGTLVASDGSIEIPTRALHVVVEDLVHVGKVYHVREISLRSQQLRGAAPSFELFLNLPDSVPAAAGRRSDPSVLLQLELAVQPTGRLGARESFVQRDAARTGRVITGSWQFTDIREISDGAKTEIRGDARVELQIERDGGVDLLAARWNGPLIWE